MVPATLYRPHMFVKDSLLDQPCTICREGAPHVQFFYSGGIVVRAHVACAALRRQG
ncbi:MAG TPA: hypothetical protein VKB36_07415 [Vicinamibacterales bacterium]|nr:hypothetical protein [Vicinamibacterales bacterium]